MSLFGSSTANKPAGLSINTGTANLFGSTNTNTPQPSATGSLFGNTASTAPSAGTLFGTGTTNNSSAGTSTGLFGDPTSTSSAPSAAGTLFGGSAAAKPTATGGLFGSSTGGSLFGNTSSNPAAAAPSSTGLFGNTAPQSSATTGTGSLFPPSNTNTNPASKSLFGTSNTTAPGTSLFGNPNTNTTASSTLFGGNSNTINTSSTLFGNTTTTQPGQNTQSVPNVSLFGNANASISGGRPSANHPSQAGPQQTQRSIFTSSIGQYTASQAAVPGVRVDASNLRPTTRFADLHEILQTELEKLDALILQQHGYADECSQAMPSVANALSYVPGDAEFCARKLAALQAALEADAAEIDALKTATRATADDAKIAFRNISALRTPAQYGGSGGAGGGGGIGLYGGAAPGPVPAGLLDGEDVASLQGRDLAAYMSRQVKEMEKKLDRFKGGLKEVEGYLQGVEAGTLARVQSAQLRGVDGNGGRRSADEQVRELAGVLREFEGGILSVAGKVGGVREATQQVMLEDSRMRGRLGGLY